jgi:hypothetical protein
MPRGPWLLVAAVLVTACVRHVPLAAVPDPNVITEAEIDASHSSTMYDAIAKLRPAYLHDRGPISILTNARDVATVFLNSEEYGPLASLRDFPPGDIQEVRYFSGVDAVTKFGKWYGTGVIQLISRNH